MQWHLEHVIVVVGAEVAVAELAHSGDDVVVVVDADVDLRRDYLHKREALAHRVNAFRCLQATDSHMC